MMNIQDFASLINQMKQGPVPRRLIFLWSGSEAGLEEILDGVEIHRCDLVSVRPSRPLPDEDLKKLLEAFISQQCRNYEKQRNEPSVLIIADAILLARYGCNMSVLFRCGISPRSAVILLFPTDSNRHLPVKTEGWVKRDTRAIIERVSKQLGEPKCIIEASGG